MSEEAEKHRERYLAAAHAMQTGVAFTMHSRSETNRPEASARGHQCRDG